MERFVKQVDKAVVKMFFVRSWYVFNIGLYCEHMIGFRRTLRGY